ncbi:MAG: hypothetical protein K6U74_04725 [Firmicutes bacterium]|nr:hypothetical protein [Bacillota bacterium]
MFENVVPLHRDRFLLTYDARDVDQFAEVCCVIARWIAERGYVDQIEKLGIDVYRVHLKLK